MILKQYIFIETLDVYKVWLLEEWQTGKIWEFQTVQSFIDCR